MYSVNSLYLIIQKATEHIEEKKENKYLVFPTTDENKEVLKKYTQLWDRIKNEIETKKKRWYVGKREKKFMKIKFSSDDRDLVV